MRTRPTRLAELSEALADTSGPIVLSGGDTKQAWLRPPAPDSTTIALDGLEGLVEHAHGDMTATVRAGTRLTDLQMALAERGQRLAIDPPLGPDDAATVGGIFATDDAGPGRLAFGALRELTIGATFVLADGTVARSGSKVIKNVAGYDLCKLFCGARGTLGAVAELTVRTHPIAPAHATVQLDCAPSDGAEAALALASGRFAPTAVTWQQGALWVRFEGARPFVQAQARLAAHTFEERGISPRCVLEGAASAIIWREANEARHPGPNGVSLAVHLPPTHWAGLLAELAPELDAELFVDVLLGRGLLCWAAGPLAPIAVQVRTVRERVLALRGQARVLTRPPALDALVDPYGPRPDSLPLMRAVHSALDPEGRMQASRYLFDSEAAS